MHLAYFQEYNISNTDPIVNDFKTQEIDHIVHLMESGKTFFESLIRSIEEANHEIHFQTYILKWDRTGKSVLEALGRAANRGVHVRLLLDAYGSNGLKEHQIRDLCGSVEFRFFGPLLSKGRFHIGRRLHHKIAVFDRKIAIVGGINISDLYHGDERSTPWLDFAVKLEGAAVNIIHRHCERIWHGGKRRVRSKTGSVQSPATKSEATGPARVRTAMNDFFRNRNEVAATYRMAFRTAKDSIDLVSGYFLPGRRVRRLMKRATKRGVRIRIILSERSDVLLARLAREYLYSWMFRNGMQVYEYLPSNVHGKVLSVDGRFTSVGSYDLNNLSTYSNIEMNVNIYDEAFNATFTSVFESVIAKDCIRLEPEKWRKKSTLLRRLACWGAYRITKTLFGISYLMAGKSER